MTGLTVIAEAGVNHNGDPGRARDMVAAAADAGADYIKFQAFRADDVVAAGTATAAYQAANTGIADQHKMLRDLELTLADFELLAAECRDRQIGFLCTAFEPQILDALIDLGMDRVKIASGELTNMPALRAAAAHGKPVLLSTGQATLEEVGAAVDVLRGGGMGDITLLHCTSLYPAPVESLNLRAMLTMADRFSLPVGYSDHSVGIHVSIAAVALGAVVIEKHFTLDRNLPGPDHAASLEPDELALMIEKLHEIRMALGDGEKRPSPAELEVASLVRRSWHTARALPEGAIIAVDDVTLKRPANGLPPATSPVGARLRVPLQADEAVKAEHLE